MHVGDPESVPKVAEGFLICRYVLKCFCEHKRCDACLIRTAEGVSAIELIINYGGRVGGVLCEGRLDKEERKLTNC